MKEMFERGQLYIDGHFEYGEIGWENGTIVKISILDEAELSSDERKTVIIPGLVDIHLHGAVGEDFCNCIEETAEDKLQKIVLYELSQGVTSILPTTMTYDEVRLAKIMKSVSDYVDKSDYAFAIQGIHLEGPFISYEKKGAQNAKYIAHPDISMVDRLNKESNNLIKLISLAPETEGAIECIEAGRDRYYFSLAHTMADYDKALCAIDAGANHITHMYNAMLPFKNREPGVIGAAFDRANVFAEIICDRVHNHEAVIRATFSMFGGDRMILISDSMEACGLSDGEYELGGQKVYVNGAKATLTDGTIAGSVTNLFECMKKAIAIGINPEAAIAAATINPAKSVGIDDAVGSLNVGKKANLLICDEEWNIRKVIFEGTII